MTNKEHAEARTAWPMGFDVFAATLDNLIEGFQLIGMDWRYKYVNTTVLRQAGVKSKSDLLGYTMQEKYPGIEHTAMFAALEKAMYEGISSNIENKFVYPDGTMRWYELRIQPVLTGIFVLSIDITDRKKQN